MSKKLDFAAERPAKGHRRSLDPSNLLSPLSPDDKFSRRLSNPDLRCKNKQVPLTRSDSANLYVSL